jgi:hypothetical protein
MKRIAMVVVAGILAGTGLMFQRSPALALSVTNLGKPTNDVSYIGPLGNFRYTKTSLHQGFKPELLFIGAQTSDKVEPVRWAMIKALSQFGTFGGVTAWPNLSSNASSPSFPSFNLNHMNYRSRYVAFVNKDLLNPRFRPFQKLSRQERALFDKYSNPLGPRSNLYAAATAAATRPDPKSLPLLVIGGYLQTYPSLPVASDDFQVGHAATPAVCPPTSCTGPYYSLTNASFSDVQQSLVTGRATAGLPQSLIKDVNAEANIITALICHADGKKPASVCGRQVIRKILKVVK